ncbi:family 43 glycosylhydrolase [Agreia pratensis]|uniref:family 43 glycosylhydrolase n=1 Tax=Agreia pratensis TaxID=150121 RepID=UPI001E2C343B|nr:family 43 glycosylhydrolase [Agreia pratensis]
MSARTRRRASRLASTLAAMALAAAMLVSGAALSATAAEPAAAAASAPTATTESGGLGSIVNDYLSRVPTDYTEESWAPFAAALTSAQFVRASAESTPAQIIEAKTSLLDAAAALQTVSAGSFEPITNNTFWTDTDGNPISSQGGGIFRFGDTYYWYGVRYLEADPYRQSPSKIYSKATFGSIPVYSSKDLVNWTFENDVATRDTTLSIPASAGSYFSDLKTLGDAAWVGRLGVTYNENTGKFVLISQMNNNDPNTANLYSVLFLQADSPTGDFSYANLQTQIVNSPTRGTGDQTVFTDDDGTDYLIFSNSRGRGTGFVSKIADSDSLSIEPATAISRNAAGREGNAMFRLDDTYYMAASALHGWNTSVNYVVESTGAGIQGTYGPEYVLPGTEKDYSHVTQTGFFVTVHGTKQDTVLYAGDRWAEFAWNGSGYNQWTPLSKTDDGLEFNSLSNWEFNAVTGEWRVGPKNNYVLNPDFAADRVAVSNITGWTNVPDADNEAASFTSNVSPGADKTRFALRLGAAGAFSGAVQQTNDVPAGVYRFSAKAKSTGGLEHARVVITGAAGEVYTLDLAAVGGDWTNVELPDLALTGGAVTVSIEARSAGGNQSVTIDGLSLVAQPSDPTALQALVDAQSGRESADYGSASWQPFAAALATAQAVLAAPAASQASLDGARAALEQAAASLSSAVTSVSVHSDRSVFTIGEALDAGTLSVTATRADGTTATLTPEQFQVAGFVSDVAGDPVVTVTVDPSLTTTDAAPVEATLTLAVRVAWNSSTAYNGGDTVAFDGSVWLASWWTSGQLPGDPNGPWQQLIEVDGVAVWTPSRIFEAGEHATLGGVEYVARWWTRGQEPGDPNGPWASVAG